MSESIIVVGHKNPDNDSIAAAVGYAYLKNEMAKRDGSDVSYEPVRLGPLPPESAWILERNGIEPPALLEHVHPRVEDVMTRNPVSVTRFTPLLEVERLLHRNDIRGIVVTDKNGAFMGVATMRKIAERYFAAADLGGDAEDIERFVIDDTIRALSSNVEHVIDEDALQFEEGELLSEAVRALSATSTRTGVVLDGDGHCRGIMTRTDVVDAPRRKVVLVDHNEVRQAVDGIEEAEVVEIIDHHRVGDISTANPILFLGLPVGSTATIVALRFTEEGIDIPASIAAVLLSAILTDTVIMKSPTTTGLDRRFVDILASVVGVDPVEFGLEVFRCRGGEADMDIHEFVGADSKEFQVGDATVLIAQHETVDLAAALEREDEARAYMRELLDGHGYGFVLLLVTDILKEGSQFIVEGDHRTVDEVFGIDSSAGVWMPGVLSRKKQVAAKILA